MKTIKILTIVSLVLLGNSCSVLTKTQIKNINAFATAAEKYTAFPGEVPRQRAALFLEERLVQILKLSDPERIKLSIGKAVTNYETLLNSADKFDVSLLLIQQYASLLSILSATNFIDDLSSNTNTLNNNLGSLIKFANTKLTTKIPLSVGDAVTKVIFLTGQKLTMARQAKALKEFIPQGQILLTITLQNVEEVMVALQDLLAQDKTKFIDTYTATIFMDQSKINYISIRQYVTVINNYDNLELLRIQCIKASSKLILAHTKLEESILQKNNLMDIYRETQDFIIALQELYKIYGKITNDVKKT